MNYPWVELVGKNIRTFRERKNMTQEELGQKVGVAMNTVSRWETGTYAVKVEHLGLLANAFGTHPASFFFDDSKQPVIIGERVLRQRWIDADKSLRATQSKETKRLVDEYQLQELVRRAINIGIQQGDLTARMWADLPGVVSLPETPDHDIEYPIGVCRKCNNSIGQIDLRRLECVPVTPTKEN